MSNDMIVIKPDVFLNFDINEQTNAVNFMVYCYIKSVCEMNEFYHENPVCNHSVHKISEILNFSTDVIKHAVQYLIYKNLIAPEEYKGKTRFRVLSVSTTPPKENFSICNEKPEEKLFRFLKNSIPAIIKATGLSVEVIEEGLKKIQI